MFGCVFILLAKFAVHFISLIQGSATVNTHYLPRDITSRASKKFHYISNVARLTPAIQGNLFDNFCLFGFQGYPVRLLRSQNSPRAHAVDSDKGGELFSEHHGAHAQTRL